MRQLVPLLTLLVALPACAPDSRTEAERLEDAARADSSAAGYTVGVRLTDQALAARVPDGSPRRTDTASRGGPRDVSGASTPILVSTTPDTGSATPLTAVTGSGAATGVRGGNSTAPRATVTSPAGRDTTPNVVKPLDPALEANFLAFDSVQKTATFQLAASDEIPQEVSFNGARRGGRTLTVPLGWRITIAFTNRDPQLPHSATIVDLNGPVPEQLPAPVFARGQTVRVDEGLLEGDADDIVFLADRVGRYLLACGVLGHAQRGQWITLDVSTTATRPGYR